MQFSDLQEVNTLINKSVTYIPDEVNYATQEQWEVARHAGDCEDFALRKLHELLSRGWSIKDLKLATCWRSAEVIVENGINVVKQHDYHAVLIVEFLKKQYVLDNMYTFIYEPCDSSYIWHKIQKEGGSKEWVIA